MRPLAALVCAGLAACALEAASCTGRRAVTHPSSQATQVEPAADDSLAPADEARLMAEAYHVARTAPRAGRHDAHQAIVDSVLITLADETAAEAQTQALAGAYDEAIDLWSEAILLLESAHGDTTLQTGRRP